MNTPCQAAFPTTVDQLEDLLSDPPERLIDACSRFPGDLLLLGVGGKMGPTMARMALRAFQQAGVKHRVIGVSRFSDPELRRRLESWGIQTIACDLLDERQVRQLPPAPRVVAMSGFKFGVRERPDMAWASNCYVPATVCRRYRDSRIAAFSTGNVYGLVPRSSGGSVETDPPRPEGEYAMTALGRERMYEYFSMQQQTPIVLLRLNYATELRYGVLVDLAQRVAARLPVDLAMSYVNVIWLADANAMALRALELAESPAEVINLAGPDILATREICRQLGERLGVEPQLDGTEHDDALLNNGQRGHQLLGRPAMPTEQMIDWTARWIAQGGATLGKPTHFQTRSGQF